MEVFIHDSNLGKKEGNEGLLKVTVPAEKVNKALDQAFKKWLNKLTCLVSVKVKCLVNFRTTFWR